MSALACGEASLTFWWMDETMMRVMCASAGNGSERNVSIRRHRHAYVASECAVDGVEVLGGGGGGGIMARRSMCGLALPGEPTRLPDASLVRCMRRARSSSLANSSEYISTATATKSDS